MNKIDSRRIDLNLLLVFEVLMAERSVTRAANRLGRTQSAVSHALARLRAQLDDPLMVKAGGRMVPSPFAEGLVEEVRLVLSHVQRILTPPESMAGKLELAQRRAEAAFRQDSHGNGRRMAN